MDAAPPTFIGPYRVLRKIGVGGMGQVHECVTGGGARVAVKTILEEYRQHPEVRERFRSEIAASKAIRGPYVADYFDSDEDELWLATRFYPWPSIRDFVAEHGPLSVEETAALAGRVAEALHNIHAAGRLHRDLTPANILYMEGDVRVIDYGISKDMSIRHGAGITGDRLAPYTWRYASPEHIAGKPVSELADYFSLGCVLTYAATGRELLDELRIKRPEIVPDILRPLVTSLTQDDPGLRPIYQTILDWTVSLESSLGAAGDERTVNASTSRVRQIAAARLKDNQLDLFAIDNQPGRVLQRMHAPAHGWSAWTVMHLPNRYDDRQAQYLAAATRSDGNSDLFVVLDNGVILHRSYRGNNGWSQWVDLDRGFAGQPVATARVGENGLDLYTTDGQGHLLHRTHDNQEWSEWSHLGPPAVNHPNVGLTDLSGGWRVTHLAAAGSRAGDRHLLVGLDNKALAYSAQRHQGEWWGWVWVSAGLACVTLSAEEEGAHGVTADSPFEDGEQYFFQHWHGWKRPWDDFEDVVAERLPDPWSQRTIVDLASSIGGDRDWDVFALLDDGAVLHRANERRDWWRRGDWQALETVPRGSQTAWPPAIDKTYLIPPLPPTTPLTYPEQ